MDSKCRYCSFDENGDASFIHKDLIEKNFSVNEIISISGIADAKIELRHPLSICFGIYEDLKDGNVISGCIYNNYGVDEDFDDPPLAFHFPISYCHKCGRKL